MDPIAFFVFCFINAREQGFSKGTQETCSVIYWLWRRQELGLKRLTRELMSKGLLYPAQMLNMDCGQIYDQRGDDGGNVGMN